VDRKGIDFEVINITLSDRSQNCASICTCQINTYHKLCMKTRNNVYRNYKKSEINCDYNSITKGIGLNLHE